VVEGAVVGQFLSERHSEHDIIVLLSIEDDTHPLQERRRWHEARNRLAPTFLLFGGEFALGHHGRWWSMAEVIDPEAMR